MRKEEGLRPVHETLVRLYVFPGLTDERVRPSVVASIFVYDVGTTETRLATLEGPLRP